jgi:2-haloacid dehalogenase
MIKALTFDLFGTLIDNASIIKVFPTLDIRVDIKSFLETWRSKHLQYAWLLTILNRYESFNELSMRALKFTAKIFSLELTEGQINKLVEARMHLDAFPDSRKGLIDLKKVKEKNKMLIYAILSNSEIDKSKEILTNAGLIEFFDYVLTVDSVRKYKPSREAYLMASEIIGIPLSEIVMVSSSAWDIAGAQSAGMLTCLIDRGEDRKEASEVIEIRPDYKFSSICELNKIKELF